MSSNQAVASNGMDPTSKRAIELKDKIAVAGLVLGMLSLLISSSTFFYAFYWNPYKQSHETLSQLVKTDRFPELTDEFHKVVPQEVFANPQNTYNSLSPEDKKKIDKTLWNILDILEALAIDVDNKTLDKDIAYDYLVLYVRRYYAWSKPFIDMRRRHYDEKYRDFSLITTNQARAPSRFALER